MDLNVVLGSDLLLTLLLGPLSAQLSAALCSLFPSLFGGFLLVSLLALGSLAGEDMTMIYLFARDLCLLRRSRGLAGLGCGNLWRRGVARLTDVGH